MKLALPFAGAVLLMAADGVSAAAQKAKAEPPPKAAAKMAPAPKGTPKVGGVPKKGPGLINPLNPVQRLAQMTPEQRERVLEQLPPERAAQMRMQLENFDRLPPAAKAKIAQAAQAITSLPPEKQRVINQSMRGMNSLPDERKRPLVKELRSLLDMSPEDRAARLNSPDFKKAYSPEEQKFLSDLSNNLPPDYPIPGRR
jgi:hypothetical protein